MGTVPTNPLCEPAQVSPTKSIETLTPGQYNVIGRFFIVKMKQRGRLKCITVVGLLTYKKKINCEQFEKYIIFGICGN